MIRYSFYSFFVFLLLISLSALAQDTGRNDSAVFVLDFNTTAEDTQTQSVIDGTPDFVQIDVNGETKTLFSCTLVLKGAVDLTGVNCDILFDSSVLNVVDIHEAQGDTNFDGRSNIADILTLAQRFNLATDEGNGLSLFNFDSSGDSANKIDEKDIEVLLEFINRKEIYWTSNENNDLSVLRESVEIFQDPAVSNSNGKIDDIVVSLLRRPETPIEGFGFDGDARIADITFEVVGTIPAEGTLIRFEDQMAIDEGTQITVNAITNSSLPSADGIIIKQ